MDVPVHRGAGFFIVCFDKAMLQKHMQRSSFTLRQLPRLRTPHSVLLRRHADMLMKNSVEICSVRKACPLCNFSNAERAFPQKAAGFVHAYLQQIFRKTDLHILLKHTAEVFGR